MTFVRSLCSLESQLTKGSTGHLEEAQGPQDAQYWSRRFEELTNILPIPGIGRRTTILRKYGQ